METIEVISRPAPREIILAVQPPSCQDEFSGSIDIVGVTDAAEPITYFFNGEEASGPFNNLIAGEYIISIIDGNNCALADTIVFTVPNELLVDLGEDIQISLGESISLSPEINRDLDELATINWNSIQSISCDTCLMLEYMPLVSDQYYLQVSDIYGCQSSDEIWVFVAKDKTIFVPNAFSPNGDNTNDEFQIYFGPAVEEILELKIYDRWGERIHESYSHELRGVQGWNGRFKDQDMPPGVYVYTTQFRLIDGTVLSRSGQLTLIK